MYTLEIDDKELTAQLDKLATLLADLSPVMQAIGEALIASTRDRLEEGISPDGTPFAPRSEATLKRYERSHESYFPTPLSRSGHMASETMHTMFGPDFLYVGSSAIQSAVMQFGAERGAFGTMKNGSPIPWGNIPARPFIGLSEGDKEMILETLFEEIAAILGGN